MEEFVKVAITSDITPGSAQTVDANGTEVALFNNEGKYYAINNTCLHKEGPLGEGELDGEIITCPWHKWEYDITNGQCKTHPNSSVSCYEVKVEGQDILVKI